MEDLIKAIKTTPIIDNHAHPLLIPAARTKYPLLAVTTEASGAAMKETPSTLSHIRAVNQLADVLGCAATWEDVVNAIDIEQAMPDDAWAKRCLDGIETVLIDDGLDGADEVFNYTWHDRLTKTKCKRIVRIEKVAEEIIDKILKENSSNPKVLFPTMIKEFDVAILNCISDPEVVGFKSVICYRTGLSIPPQVSTIEVEKAFLSLASVHLLSGKTNFKRLDSLPLNSYFVHKTALMIQNSESPHKKPFQFHTGLGDNDITLTRSSPSHLQGFIRTYPLVPIVLLHASYPWTKEAGYLASVYDNVYADIGEVFPFVSKDGQEKVIGEILELCPTEKILWSTDGHWFPETYLLAIIQVREALEAVLSNYVQNKVLTVQQAVKAVEDLLFNTSNKLYGLKLPRRSLTCALPQSPASGQALTMNSDLSTFTTFLAKNPSTKFLRLQYLDYTATPRLRVVPVKHALSVLRRPHGHLSIGITKASLGLLQNDTIIPNVTATGEYRLYPIFSSILAGPCEGYASVQCEFHELDNSDVDLCPRSTLRNTINRAKSHGLEFLVGFEIEVVFMSRLSSESAGMVGLYTTSSGSEGHAWSSARALQSPKIRAMVDDIYEDLSKCGIDLEQWHPESATGQFEFILPPLPPLEAVDALLHARDVISTVSARHSMRATLHPKPFPDQAGTASHVHISISSAGGENTNVYEPFYAGILRHLPAIAAFTYSNDASYERATDSCWAGGRWITWGTQNRETPLRKIAGSHWEIKCLDGLANVYLAISAILAAGTKGVADGLVLSLRDCEHDPARLTSDEREALGIVHMLPRSLKESVARLLEDDELMGLLGGMASRYLDVKAGENILLEAMTSQARKDWLIDRY